VASCWPARPPRPRGVSPKHGVFENNQLGSFPRLNAEVAGLPSQAAGIVGQQVVFEEEIRGTLLPTGARVVEPAATLRQQRRPAQILAAGVPAHAQGVGQGLPVGI
jgi:hypothetical protein